MKDKRKKHAKKLKGVKKYFEELREKLRRHYYKPINTKGTFNNNYMEYESRGDKNKNLSFEDYLDIIWTFLGDMINNHRINGKWKIQLIIQINFISLETGEFCTMYSESSNVKIMIGIETNDIINELFESFFERYQEGLETKIREWSNFFF